MKFVIFFIRQNWDVAMKLKKKKNLTINVYDTQEIHKMHYGFDVPTLKCAWECVIGNGRFQIVCIQN